MQPSPDTTLFVVVRCSVYNVRHEQCLYGPRALTPEQTSTDSTATEMHSFVRCLQEIREQYLWV